MLREGRLCRGAAREGGRAVHLPRDPSDRAGGRRGERAAARTGGRAADITAERAAEREAERPGAGLPEPSWNSLKQAT